MPPAGSRGSTAVVLGFEVVRVLPLCLPVADGVWLALFWELLFVGLEESVG